MYSKSFPSSYGLLFYCLLSVYACAPESKTPLPPAQELVNTKEFVPQWAKTVVWYQIFPERFRNGDPNNDPTVQDILGADPQEPPRQWQIHPWGSDWYQLQDYELANGEPEFWKHLLRRRYGGDLQGIIDQLDYLHDLGITAIYLNPVFDAPSLHKYDGASYHHIDPNFGPDPEGDRLLMQQENPLQPETWVWTSADELALELIAQAHSKGMRVIFDGVFNHMGINSFAFKDLMRNQERSPYKDWFNVTSFRNLEKGTSFEYEGWWGVPSLPELKEDENGIVEGPCDYIFVATDRWMNPKNKGTQHGIDGWRLDVAFCVDHAFWKRWRKKVRSINPEAYLTAEIVDVPEKVIPYLQGDEFDAEMNYNFSFACTEFLFNPGTDRISVSQFNQNLKKLRNLYPDGVAYVCQNLFGSHDVNRIGSHIVNRGIGNFRDWGSYYGISKAIENPEYSPRKPNADDIQLQKLFTIFQMTYVGAPMIYYGDEVGMWGANDPDCRKPMIWNDLTYANETHYPSQKTHTADSVTVNRDLLNHYKKLIQIRNNNPVLQLGDFSPLIVDDSNEVFVFKRKYQEKEIIVVFNNSNISQHIDIKIDKTSKFNDLLNKKIYKKQDGSLRIQVPRKWAAVLKPAS